MSAAVSRRCPGPRGRFPRVAHPCAAPRARGPGALDLHVLGAPPAFVLSQDQTLSLVHCCGFPLARRPAPPLAPLPRGRTGRSPSVPAILPTTHDDEKERERRETIPACQSARSDPTTSSPVSPPERQRKRYVVPRLCRINPLFSRLAAEQIRRPSAARRFRRRDRGVGGGQPDQDRRAPQRSPVRPRRHLLPALEAGG